jgi:hypothetical protein
MGAMVTAPDSELYPEEVDKPRAARVHGRDERALLGVRGRRNFRLAHRCPEAARRGTCCGAMGTYTNSKLHRIESAKYTPHAAPDACLRGHCAMRCRTSGMRTSPPNPAISVSLRY